ncbi:hypothetical protein CEXT_129461 [Caerostris extrusa]|uniref:Uncharacterized protein n=1 Tax=Caerostris extrusa TaxID=172846 RepID=A0AAV4NK72_CAEEX|nr:hypothetical protein CEXT_129461 [Caerostris extrusa]
MGSSAFMVGLGCSSKLPKGGHGRNVAPTLTLELNHTRTSAHAAMAMRARRLRPSGRSSELQKKIESITRRRGEAEKPCGVEFFESLVHKDRVINGDTVIH